MLEFKVYLSWSGIVSIIFALVTSYGACSYFGFVVSPLHNFIPFLLLGIGVDDMFVIVRTIDYIKRNSQTYFNTGNLRINGATNEDKGIYCHQNDIISRVEILYSKRSII